MIQKIRKFSLSLLAAGAILMPGLVPALAVSAIAAPATTTTTTTTPATTTAPTSTIKQSLCTGTSDASNDGTTDTCGTSGASGETSGIKTVAAQIVNVFSIIVGVVAVIMIIYGGFRYITSGGDSGKVGNAKNTLIYAIIGLIIVAVAQIIVHYVINTASSSTNGLT